MSTSNCVKIKFLKAKKRRNHFKIQSKLYFSQNLENEKVRTNKFYYINIIFSVLW